MLNEDIQQRLAKRYGGAPLQKMVKEAFDKERIVKALKEPFEKETAAFSAITFMDIAGFSSKVAGMDAAKTRAFLDEFYKAAIPKIYQHHGHIDRIVGDGILAVYSPHLSPDELKTRMDAETAAMDAAEKLITDLHGTKRVLMRGEQAPDVVLPQQASEHKAAAQSQAAVCSL